tara:strand:- start:3318 stop:3923 length:606 start_codon:yes stop_codon:yes gene_type:complete
MSLPEQTAKAKAASNYAAARATIERTRLLPWASAVGIQIGDFTVAPLCFRSLIDLELAGNAFTVGDEPIAGDIAAYIWRHLAEFTPSADNCKFIKQIARVENIDELIEGIYSHIMSPFDETPAESSFGKTSTQNKLPAIPSIAAICDEYGAAYGIDPQDVADIDLRIVFQCCRAQRIRNGAKYSDPKKLRALKSDFLTSHG